MPHKIVDASKQYNSLEEDIPTIKIHTMMGIRRALVYSIAEKENLTVVSCGTKSELHAGLFCMNNLLGEILPISHLYKTQVYQLAESLAAHGLLPEGMANKPSHCGITGEPNDEDVMGMHFEEFDTICYLLENKGYSPSKTAKTLGKATSQIENIKEQIELHKRMIEFPSVKT